MKLDDIKISRAIIEKYTQKLLNCLELDVAIVGAGPSGLTAAYFIAKANKKVAVFERKLSIGGGMWGGGMMFNEIVVQESGKQLLDTFKVTTKLWEQGYWTADGIECVCSLGNYAIKAGAKIFNAISVEDVLLKKNKVNGLVINWSAIESAKLHVDPLTIRAKHIVEATGHPTEILRILRKKGMKLKTPSGEIEGEGSMCADIAEKLTIKNTKEIFPGVWVAGMAANAGYGGPRMGPIFGGMLMSGKCCAQKILTKL